VAVQILMPQLGESVVEGTLARWLKQPGDPVAEFEAVLEVDTDKVASEIPSPAGGVLLVVLVPEGQTVRAGTLLAWIGQPGEVLPEQIQPLHPSLAGAVAPLAGEDARPVIRPGRSPELGFISPVVAKIAREYNLDLAQVRGTGEGGRITKKDVLAALETRQSAAGMSAPWETPADGDLFRPSELIFPGQPSAAQPLDLSQSPPAAASTGVISFSADARDELLPLTSMRRSIADAMVLSKRSAPHVTTIMEADMSRVAAHRAASQAPFEREGVHLTYTVYFGMAVIQALRAHPLVNSSWSEAGIQLHGRIHLGFAVALGEDGLIVPVIRDADGLSLIGLARGLNDLASRGRTLQLKPDEVRGGTFTITNHGTGGSLFATPVINPPQCGILGVGAIQKRVVVVEDMIAVRPMVYLSFTFDHRILDGRKADAFLAKVKAALENWQ
jgi:pyruvate/2-oxoglutarate dehydrogenase complex dihydrolipoamide acyltransferase (E2) component